MKHNTIHIKQQNNKTTKTTQLKQHNTNTASFEGGTQGYSGDIVKGLEYPISAGDSIDGIFVVTNNSDEMILKAAYSDTSFQLHDLTIEIARDFTDDGHGSYSYIYLAECYKERTCGLCGVWDDDTDNDFSGADGTEYPTSDVSTIAGMPPTAWTTTHTYADTWSDGDIATLAGQSACAPSTGISQADEDCLDRAGDFCQSIWGSHCTACVGTDYEDRYDTWLDNCAFDSCAASGDNLDDTSAYPDVDSAEAAGYFDGAIQVECQCIFCLFVFVCVILSVLFCGSGVLFILTSHLFVFGFFFLLFGIGDSFLTSQFIQPHTYCTHKNEKHK